jgi:hypothetical protein
MQTVDDPNIDVRAFDLLGTGMEWIVAWGRTPTG